VRCAPRQAAKDAPKWAFRARALTSRFSTRQLQEAGQVESKVVVSKVVVKNRLEQVMPQNGFESRQMSMSREDASCK